MDHATFTLDAAIIFSDILTVPDAMGLGLYFAEGEGPRFKKPTRTPELNDFVPLIGFCGSPWTVATYMIEGSGSKEYVHTKKLMYGDEAALHNLLGKVTHTSISYLQAQAEAGAQALMVFDTWGGILTPKGYYDYSLRYMQDIVTALSESHPDIPVILFTKNGGMWLPEIARTGSLRHQRPHQTRSIKSTRKLRRRRTPHIQPGPWNTPTHRP